MSSDGTANEYHIVFARSARKELESLPQNMASRVLQRIESLASNPRPAGAIKLVGSESLWRIRIGDYRVVYQIDDNQLLVDVVVIRHRRDAYQ
jgi:mRNA interferase RelE/StbE